MSRLIPIALTVASFFLPLASAADSKSEIQILVPDHITQIKRAIFDISWFLN